MMAEFNVLAFFTGLLYFLEIALATLLTMYESVLAFFFGFNNFKWYLMEVFAIRAEDLPFEDSAKDIKKREIDSAAFNGIFLDSQKDLNLFQ